MKILSYGDNPLTSTGYGQVWNNLLSRWVEEKPDWEFLHVGWQSRDRPHQRKEGYWMLPNGKIEYSYDNVASNLKKYNPEVLVTLCDVGWQSGFIQGVFAAKRDGWRGKWIMYTPIDSNGWAMDWSEIFDACDVNIAMSKWGENMMNKMGAKKVLCIPHGVDTKTFYPMADRSEIRKKYKIDDKFVIGWVGRNQQRKMLDRLIMAFAKFSQGKDDAILMLHTDAEPPKSGWSLAHIIDKYKLGEKVKLTKSNMDVNTRQLIQPDNMNEIYNMMDFFCYNTGGEGFGLPGIEAQGSGVPIAMPAFTTGFELTGNKVPEDPTKMDYSTMKSEGHGALIPLLQDSHGRCVPQVGQNTIPFYFSDEIEMANIMEDYYNSWKGDKKKLKEESEAVRKFALTYDWDNLAKEWITLFENV